MLANYFKIAIRNFKRHKGYTFINVAGLAVGMACCLLMLLYVRDELRYDRYHEQAERIHRLIRETSAYTAAPMAPALAADLPIVEQAARIDYDEVEIRQGDQLFEETLFFADSSLFSIFSFELVRGDPATALTRPDALVITETAARKYFGQDDPVGRTRLFALIEVATQCLTLLVQLFLTGRILRWFGIGLANLAFRYTKGLYHNDGRHLHVTAGVGSWGRRSARGTGSFWRAQSRPGNGEKKMPPSTSGHPEPSTAFRPLVMPTPTYWGLKPCSEPFWASRM